VISFPKKLGVQGLEGQVAEDFTLDQLDGEPVTLSELRGQAVMLNFWATWCGYCRIEMAEIQSAYEMYQDAGFTVLGINVQEGEDIVRDFARDMGLTFPLLLDAEAEVALGYGVRGLPTSLFIDQEGIVSAVHIGPLDQTTIERYLAEVGVK
jgi:peroxiredoxin